MKYINVSIIVLILVGMVVYLGVFLGIIGIYKFEIIDDQPMDNGLIIEGRNGNIIQLSDGINYEYDENDKDLTRRSKLNVGDKVEIIKWDTNEFAVKAEVKRVFGKNRDPPIMIPIIKRTIYRYEVKIIGSFHKIDG